MYAQSSTSPHLIGPEFPGERKATPAVYGPIWKHVGRTAIYNILCCYVLRCERCGLPLFARRELGEGIFGLI